MSQPKKTTAPAKKIWRISEGAPMGEWVNEGAPVTPKQMPDVAHGPWVRSSHDLLDGADVTEDPDTLPDDLFDELFPPKQDAQNNSRQ